MNLNLPSVVMFVAGVVLMYSAVKNRDPRYVVLTALGRKEAEQKYGKALADAARTGLSAGAGVVTAEAPAKPPIKNPVWV